MMDCKELKKVIVGEFIKEATITTREGKKYYFVDFSFDKGLLNKVADNILEKLSERNNKGQTSSDEIPEAPYISLCPMCGSILLYPDGKCSNNDCAYVYKKEEK